MNPSRGKARRAGPQPMERVKARYPAAYCEGHAGKSFISFHIKNGANILGIGDTVRGAWRDAARKL